MNHGRQWIAAVTTGLVLLGATLPARAQTMPAPSSQKVTQAADSLIQTDSGLEGKKLPRQGQTDDGGRGLRDWIQMFVALAVVVVLIFLTRYVLQRLGRHAGMIGRAEGMDVIGQLALTGKHRLFLVRLGSRLVLVGCGPEGMARLSEVSDSREISELLARFGKSDGAKSSQSGENAGTKPDSTGGSA